MLKSRASEGWTALPALYDDGGFSDGNMECSALKQLLDVYCQTNGNSSQVDAMSPNPTYCLPMTTRRCAKAAERLCL